MTITTAKEAVDQSVQSAGQTVLCGDTPENRDYLELTCGDYRETDRTIEYWSTKEDDGADWRVIIPL